MHSQTQISTIDQELSDQQYRSIAEALYLQAKDYFSKKEYNKGIEYADKAFNNINNIKAKTSADLWQSVKYSRFIGACYSVLGLDEAIICYEKTAKIIFDSPNKDYGTWIYYLGNFYEIGEFFFKSDQHEKVIQYYQYAEKIIAEHTNKDICPPCWHYLGHNLATLGEKCAKNGKYHLVQERINYYIEALNCLLKSIGVENHQLIDSYHYIAKVYKDLAGLYFGDPLAEYLKFFAEAFTRKSTTNNNIINFKENIASKLMAICFHIKKNPYGPNSKMLLQFLVPFMLGYEAAVSAGCLDPEDDSLIKYINDYGKIFSKEIDDLTALIKTPQPLQENIINSPNFYVGVSKTLEGFNQKIIEFEEKFSRTKQTENNNNGASLAKLASLDQSSPLNTSKKPEKSQDIITASNEEHIMKN